MMQVSLDFLIDEVDVLFGEYNEHHDNKYLDMAFYAKSYDGGKNHEIYSVWTVHHDETNLSKPYVITKYVKEYMWNMLISFQQVDYDIVKEVEKDTITEVIDYLIEENVVPETFTYAYPNKNTNIYINTDTKNITYSINVAWVDEDVCEGDYSDIYSFTLDTSTIPHEKINSVHETIVNYFTYTYNTLIADKNPETIINKLNRMKKGPFAAPSTQNINMRYKHWNTSTDDTSTEDNDIDDDTNHIISEHYTLDKQYSINSVRVDIVQVNTTHEIITSDLVLQFNFNDEKIYTTFDTHSSMYDRNNIIWSYNNALIKNVDYKTDIFDSYWSMYENKLYDQAKLELYTHYIIQDLIDTAIADTRETADITDTADTRETADITDTADTVDTADKDNDKDNDNDMVILEKPTISMDSAYFTKGLSCMLS